MRGREVEGERVDVERERGRGRERGWMLRGRGRERVVVERETVDVERVVVLTG